MHLLDSLKKWMEKSIVDEIILVAIFVAIFESLAQNTLINSKQGSLHYFVGLLFYMGLGYILHWGYTNFPMSKLNVTWACLSIVIAVTVGYLIYEEEVNKFSILSVVFALIAVYFSYLS